MTAPIWDRKEVLVFWQMYLPFAGTLLSKTQEEVKEIKGAGKHPDQSNHEELWPYRIFGRDYYYYFGKIFITIIYIFFKKKTTCIKLLQ